MTSQSRGQMERSLEELYTDDPERADALVFGRIAKASRRGFLGGAGLGAMGAAVGGALPFAAHMPAGLVPAALAQGAGQGGGGAAAAPKGPQLLQFPGKDKNLVVLGEKPLVAETPEALLDDDTTPVEKFFIRNNGQIPDPVKDADAWRFSIEGETDKALDLTLGELKARYKPRTYRMVLECGGNGRSGFQPPARGNQWTNGGAGCAEWTGVRLADLFKAAGLKPTARFTAHYGADPHLSGDTKREALSRGMPIAKAMQSEVLVAWAMNGEPLTDIHGGPVRLIVPGWPGSLSHKWLKRIVLRDKEHDGQGMGGTSYRVPTVPIVPGSSVDGKESFKNLESMPVRSILTSPANGTKLAKGTREVALRGAAWAGDFGVKRVDVSLDFGQSWKKMTLAPPRNRFDWTRWSGKLALPSDGYFEIWARATDERGLMQPHVAANWNPQGYGANPMHRIAILVG